MRPKNISGDKTGIQDVIMHAIKFYNKNIRNVVILFGTVFNDISIKRTNNSGNVIETIKVPVAYGPKQKFLIRLRQDPSLDRQVAIQLPRLAFEMSGIAYDPIRKLNNIVFSPHRAGALDFAFKNMGEIVYNDMERIVKNLQPIFCKKAEAKTVKLLRSKPVDIS